MNDDIKKRFENSKNSSEKLVTRSGKELWKIARKKYKLEKMKKQNIAG